MGHPSARRSVIAENPAPVASELTLYRDPVTTVFDLLGDKENDITYSLGWALAQSDRLTYKQLADVFPPAQPRSERGQGVAAGGDLRRRFH